MLWDRKVLIFDRFCKFWTGHFLWEENNMNNLCFHCNPPRSPPQGIVAEEIAGLGEQGTKGLQWHTEGMEGRTDAFFRVTHGDTYRVAWKWLLPICLDSGLWFETIGRADVLLFQHRWDVYTCQRGGTLRCHFFSSGAWAFVLVAVAPWNCWASSICTSTRACRPIGSAGFIEENDLPVAGCFGFILWEKHGTPVKHGWNFPYLTDVGRSVSTYWMYWGPSINPLIVCVLPLITGNLHC